jgi:putative peptide zinc metalloprotease protein
MAEGAVPSPARPPRRPRIRPDLEIKPQTFQGRSSYVIKDPVALRYFRLQKEEYAIVEALDGTHDLRDLHRLLVHRFPGLETNEKEVLRVVNQLAAANLLVIETPDRADHLFESRRRRRDLRFKNLSNNILYVKLPVVDPDEFFTRLHRRVRFLWSRPVFVLWLLTILAAGALVLARWEEASARAPQFFTLHNLFFLWLAIGLMKVLHEFGHGLTCKHYGGEVHELGYLFLVLTPCLYVNISDAWMIPHRRGKLLTTAAGVMTELWVAALATFVWWWAPEGFVDSLAFNLAVAGSVSAVAFNANPLLRYDGYYFLMDLLELPNLRMQSHFYLRSIWHRLVLGVRSPTSGIPVQYPRFFIFYAVASYIYRWVILVGIVYLLTHLLDRYDERLGSVSRLLGGIVVLTMFLKPAWVGLRRTIKFRKELQVRPARVAMVVSGAAVTLGLIGLIPVSERVRGPAVVDAQGSEFVWVRTPGIVREVLVKEGDLVSAGQVLARLENDGAATDAQVLGLRVRQERAAALAFHAAADYSGEARALVLAQGAESQLAERRAELGQLTLTAPAAGAVFARDLDQLVGRYLPRGALFCRIADARRLEARILIDENQYGSVCQAVQQSAVSTQRSPVSGQQSAGIENPESEIENPESIPARVTFFGRPGRVYHGAVRRVSVGDVSVIPYPALIAHYGGEVVARQDRSGAVVPLKTQYEAVVQFDDQEAPTSELLFGMTGRATILCRRVPLFRLVYNWIADAVAPKMHGLPQ